MRTYDLSPLWRSTIGFDRLLGLIEDPMNWTAEDNYPPYNIERSGDDRYRVSLALAGFRPDEITVTAGHGRLTVESRKADQGHRDFLYQGIPSRPFRRVFKLSDYVQVKGATFTDGLLKIDLVREVPEAMRPRRIAIASGSVGNDNREIPQQAAA